ncbi:MAG: hypothetical protein BWY15_01764 [Firmicutes bacterium ADurb.Bin193]|nr:MAG: hypothetical protein BWY15_01764 [Firmicutes bacterium ADurb.Bin193]
MSKIEITSDDVIMFYGNKAGYIKNNTAFVDLMFQRKEMLDFLKSNSSLDVEWKDGVFDALINNTPADAISLKKCRIYQLKPDADPRIKFISLNDLIMKGFGKPKQENYRVVFDGEVKTNRLEDIYDKFNIDIPDDFEGHSMSMSDIIELYDDNGSAFHYVDSFGFKEVEMRMQQSQTEEAGLSQHEEQQQEQDCNIIMKFTM